MSASAFTTVEKIEKRLSSQAVDDRIDDDPSAIDECILLATLEIKGYLSGLYSENSLGASAWVQMHATTIALWYLCGRRGNPIPTSVQLAYENTKLALEKAMGGYPPIPDAPMRRSAAPVITNQRVSLAPFPHLVNLPSTSTSKREGYPPNDDRTDIDLR